MSEDVSGGSPTAWYSKRWLVIASIFFAVFSMAVVGIAAAAHLTWQASPEKAMLDALDYSTKTPATYKVAAKDITATVSYDGTRHAAKGSYKNVKFDAVVDGLMLYVKSETPAELVKLFTSEGLPENLRPMTDAITTRITDKWVSVSLERLPQTNANESKYVSCALTARSQLTTNKEAKKELTKLYENNSFFVIDKAATTDASTAYRVTFNDGKFGDFTSAFTKSNFYKSLRSECETPVQSVVNHKNQDSQFVADVMLSKSKNALQKATIKSANSGTTTVDVQYGDVGKITVPSDAISYDSISSGIVQTMVWSYLNGNQ